MRRNKFGAKPVVVDGIRFASTGEAMRYTEIKLLVSAGKISRLELQKKFALTAHNVKIGYYIADFFYWDVENKAWTVEDYKGMRTPMFNWKWKHLRAQHPTLTLMLTGRSSLRRSGSSRSKKHP